MFTVGALTFGIMICGDSLYPELARVMALQGAVVLFVPTNNGMPAAKGGAELIAEARNTDIARAIENSVSVIRADVAGRFSHLVSKELRDRRSRWQGARVSTLARSRFGHCGY